MYTVEKTPVERLMLTGLAATLAVLLLAGGFVWLSAEPLSTFKSVDRIREVLSELDTVRSKLERAENQQWAYFLTREPSFLVQRDRDIEDLHPALKRLGRLTLDNAVQQARVGQLQVLVDKRIGLLQQSQETFDARSFAAVRGLFDEGRRADTAARKLIQEAENEAQVLLGVRKGSEDLRIGAMVGGIALLLLFLAVLYVKARYLMHRRMQVQHASLASRMPLLKAGVLQAAIFNSTSFSSIATDANGVIQIFNVGAEHMLGYTAADVVDKVTPAGISDSQELIERAAALSKEFGTAITPGFEALVFKAARSIEDICELTYIRKDGSRFPAIVSVTALRDDPGAIIGYLLIGTDNTARKQAAQQQALLDQRLRDQQFYTRSLIESNIDALITTDPRGIISDVNKQMETLTGCSRDELIGARFKDYFTDPERAEAGIRRVLQEGKVTNYELTARAQDGRLTVVSYNATTFHDRERKLQGVFAAARDITERKEIEHALQDNNVKLEAATAVAKKANLAKSEFLSSMSHELRTPLNAVLGFAQLLASETPPPTPVQKRSLDRILQAGWHLLRLINEVLDLAMIESGKVAISQETISLTEVLQDCQAMMGPQAAKRGMRMAFPTFDNPFYVSADRTRVKQVMINLLSNAIKYNRDDGTVTVLCVMSADKRVRVSVADTGMGLGPEQLANLFQPFNRLGQESGGEEGTGIGLVVTKQLVELMGGHIGVESSVGGGCVFWVELEAAAAPHLALGGIGEIGPHVADLDPARAAAFKRTVLCVEDNPANLALIEQLVARRADLKLLTAVDGQQGIQLARAFQPDVILMDINLPGMSGFGALKILQEDPSTAHIPVMALSANAVPRDIEKGVEAGFFRYLTKPIKVAEFMEALDVALEFSAQGGITRELAGRQRSEAEAEAGQ